MRLRVLSIRLFIITGLSLLIFYICHLISTRLIDKIVIKKEPGVQKPGNVNNIIEKSVYLRDKGTDPLIPFSAYRQGLVIYVILPSFGYFQ